MHRAVPVACLVLLAACRAFPRDPQHTLDRIRDTTLTVGVSDDPPFIIRHGNDASGSEAELIRGFAQRLHADVKWRWGGQEAQLEELSKFRLDIVAGELPAKSPWKSKVAITRPYDELHSLAVPPGENAFLLELEKYLAERRR